MEESPAPGGSPVTLRERREASGGEGEKQLELEVHLLAVTPQAEKVIEEAGRTCYLSFHRQGPESDRRFIRMLIERGHESVLEHATASFRIRGGSRSFTHQLVRHRLASYSQQSQRYVDEQNFQWVEPPGIGDHPEARAVFSDFMNQARETYRRLQAMGILNEDARYVLPNAVCSEIVVSANFREWRHILRLRGSRKAQWEIRRMAAEILRILKREAPSVFYDLDTGDRQGAAKEFRAPVDGA